MNEDIQSSIHLRRTDENVDDIRAAEKKFGERVGIDGVLAHLNRQAVRAPVPGQAVEWGFRWNDDDGSTQRWWPQGITTSADASDDEDIGGRRLLMTSWYSKTLDGENHGSRITIVDIDTLEYRHVLLVVPERTWRGLRLKPLLVHAGGLVWCGPYLHVAGTKRGLFTLPGRRHHPARGHRGQLRLPLRAAGAVRLLRGGERGRGADALLLPLPRPDLATPRSWSRVSTAVVEDTRRLVRYPLDPETYHLAAHEDGTSRPVWLDDCGLGHMQGAATVRDTYYVTASRGRYRLGQVYVGQPGSFRRLPRTLPVGPEDITYWPSTDMLWSLTEYPGRRFVFAMKRAQFDKAPDRRS